MRGVLDSSPHAEDFQLSYAGVMQVVPVWISALASYLEHLPLTRMTDSLLYIDLFKPQLSRPISNTLVILIDPSTSKPGHTHMVSKHGQHGKHGKQGPANHMTLVAPPDPTARFDIFDTSPL